MPSNFLNASNVRSIGEHGGFGCEASVIGLQRGHFPAAIETDLGNGDPIQLDRPVFDEIGNFEGAAYRQSGGCEVLVLLD